MKPVVYIDMLFLLNFLMNTVTVYLTSVFLRKSIHIARLCITAAVCALYSLVMFFPQLSILYSVLFKVIFWVTTAELAFPERTFNAMLKNSLAFLASNLICGGAVFMLIFATDFGTATGSAVSNGEIYINIGFGTLLAASILAYITVFIISLIKKQNFYKENCSLSVTVFLDGKSAELSVLCDTGCNLCDPISGTPVLIISPQIAKQLGTDKLPAHRYRFIPFSTIDGKKSFMTGFMPDKIVINKDSVYRPTIAIAEGNLKDYDGILNPDLIQLPIQKGCEFENECNTTV